MIFLDADDYYENMNNLEILYKNAKEQNVEICGGLLSILNNGKKYLQTTDDNNFGFYFDKDKIIYYKDYQFDCWYHRFIYNRKFLIQNNIFFPNYKRFQDPPFFVKAMHKAGKFYALSCSTYLYRNSHKQINWTFEKQNDLLKGIKDNLDFAKKYKLNRLYYYTALRLSCQDSEAFKNFFTLDKRIKSTLKNIIKNLDFDIIYSINPKFTLKLTYTKQISKILLINLFSIKNNQAKTHKILTILGIKIKFKRRKND